MTDQLPLSEEEYSARFISHMVAEALRQFGIREFPDDISIEEYARTVAPSYWAEYDLLRDATSPEQSAEADISYWCDR